MYPNSPRCLHGAKLWPIWGQRQCATIDLWKSHICAVWAEIIRLLKLTRTIRGLVTPLILTLWSAALNRWLMIRRFPESTLHLTWHDRGNIYIHNLVAGFHSPLNCEEVFNCLWMPCHNVVLLKHSTGLHGTALCGDHHRCDGSFGWWSNAMQQVLWACIRVKLFV